MRAPTLLLTLALFSTAVAGRSQPQTNAPRGDVGLRGQDGFTITGRITGIPDSMKLMLWDVSADVYIDSAYVSDGEFRFNGSLNDEPEQLRIISAEEYLDDGVLYYTDLLMGNEDVRVEGDVSDLPNNVSTSGSETQSEAEVYRKQLHARNIAIDSLRAVYDAFPDSVDSPERSRAQAALDTARADRDAWQRAFVIENFDSYIALLTYSYLKNLSPDTLATLYESLPDGMKASKFGRAVGVQVEHPAPQVGDRAYDFEAVDVNGNPFQISESGGKYTLLQFAGTGCYGSNLSVEAMKGLVDEYGDDVSFVSFFAERRDKWVEYTRDRGLTWTSVWEDDGRYGNVYNQYGVTGTPTFFLISPEGKVVSTWFGYWDGIIEDEIRGGIE